MKINKIAVLAFVLQLQFLLLIGVVQGQGLIRDFGFKKMGNELIPKEPGWNHPSYRGWEVMSIPGLISTYYDLDQDGELDYMVIRKINRKVSAEEVPLEQAIQIAKYDRASLFISHPVIYFTQQYPLFYCLGLDFRRNCRNIWVDVAEDGLNGNEESYTLSSPRPNVR